MRESLNKAETIVNPTSEVDTLSKHPYHQDVGKLTTVWLMGFTKLDVPLPETLASKLHAFWGRIFGVLNAPLELFLGSEQHHNANIVYMAHQGGHLAGTCLLTVSKTVPTLGGLGEVATEPGLRRGGVATELCRMAVEYFREQGGEALFLGTGNPDAARIYYRLGWRRLAGSNIWLNVTSDQSPEEFMADYFRTIKSAITVAPANPTARIPMIPLIATPHDWQVLDANVDGQFSTRHRTQLSTMGQYPKYQAVSEHGLGAWFTASSGDGQVVGISTARLDEDGRCQIDAFTHHRFDDCWESLARASMNWGHSQNSTALRVQVSVEDENKKALFESLGFRCACQGDDFELDNRSVGSVWLDLS